MSILFELPSNALWKSIYQQMGQNRSGASNLTLKSIVAVKLEGEHPETDSPNVMDQTFAIQKR